MNKLIFLLKYAHAVEIGAYNAYEGHWRSLPNGSIAQDTIKAIQIDEKNHQQALEGFLQAFNSKPSPILDGILWCIGKSISMACHFMGYNAAMLGAKIMEKLGSAIYFNLAREAASFDSVLSNTLYTMGTVEEDHERFISILRKEHESSTAFR